MRTPIVLLLGLASAVGSDTRAEVRATGPGPATGAAVLCECSPSSPLVWQAVITPTSSHALNLAGLSNGDRAPALGISSGTGAPFAVWPEWDGNDFEIVLSMFDGASWTPRERLTDNSVDDTQPSVASLAGGAVAAVWRSGLPIARIQYRQRESSGAWSPIIDVSDGLQTASNPVAVATGSRIRVAYVEMGNGGSRFVKIASGGIDPEPWPSVFEPEIIAITYWDGELAPGLFAVSNGPISIWTDSSIAIGYSRFNGANWTAPQFEPYAGEADLERARIRAKQRALQEP